MDRLGFIEVGSVLVAGILEPARWGATSPSRKSFLPHGGAQYRQVHSSRAVPP